MSDEINDVIDMIPPVIVFDELPTIDMILAQIAELPSSVRDGVVSRFLLRATRDKAMGEALETFYKLGLHLGDLEATIPDVVCVAEESGDPEALALLDRALTFLREVHRLDQEMKRDLARDGHLS